MHITIHRGTHEIGGNCVEIATEKTRIILDIGMPLFNEDREPHDSSALRRQSSERLRQTGVLPQVSGLFDDDEQRPDAILISHAHEDHTGLLRHTPTETPVYTSVGTSKMMQAGARFAGQPALPQQRHRELHSGQPTQIGDFTVTAFSVDHSIYGAQAFLIEADGKTVLYSGDLRMHGRKPGMHKSLIEAVQGRTIDVLLMEGTHINHPNHRGPNEYELENEIVGHIQSAPGLVFASFSPQHVDRLVGFFRAAKKTNRVFVADAYTAFVMHLIASETSLPRPESTAGLKVFFPRYFEETYEKKMLADFHTRMSPARIELEEIRSNPSQYVMLFRPSMLDSDFGGNLPKGATCLYSRWSGYLQNPDWLATTEALAAADGELIEAHTSGHIFYDDIVSFVGRVNARTVVPIHTFEPEKFAAFVPNLSLLADGETLSC